MNKLRDVKLGCIIGTLHEYFLLLLISFAAGSAICVGWLVVFVALSESEPINAIFSMFCIIGGIGGIFLIGVCAIKLLFKLYRENEKLKKLRRKRK